jgi:hypothetical protein
LVQSGEWTEAQLLELMDAYLMRAVERALFGLAVPGEKETGSQAAAAEKSLPEGQGKAAAAEQKSVKPPSAKRVEAKATTAVKPTSARRKKPDEERVDAIAQDDLLDEFNL